MEIPEIDELRQIWLLAPGIVTEELFGGMEESLLLLVAEIAKETPVDRGYLRTQIQQQTDIDRDGLNVTGKVTTGNAIYGPAVEHGTQPHWPPADPIEEWVRRKGLHLKQLAAIKARRQTARAELKAHNANKRNSKKWKSKHRRLYTFVNRRTLKDVEGALIKQIAFLIRRKIAKQGTEGAHMFEKGFEAAEPHIRNIFRRRFTRAVDRIAGRL
jgi:hypothetical protein